MPSLRGSGEVHGVGIEAAGIGGVGKVVDARSRSQGGSPAIMTIGRAAPSRMTSSGVKRDRPWMCSPVAAETVPGLRRDALCWDRLAVSKRMVRCPRASLMYLAVS
jgi:hypothetical protein